MFVCERERTQRLRKKLFSGIDLAMLYGQNTASSDDIAACHGSEDPWHICVACPSFSPPHGIVQTRIGGAFDR